LLKPSKGTLYLQESQTGTNAPLASILKTTGGEKDELSRGNARFQP